METLHDLITELSCIQELTLDPQYQTTLIHLAFLGYAAARPEQEQAAAFALVCRMIDPTAITASLPAFHGIDYLLAANSIGVPADVTGTSQTALVWNPDEHNGITADQRAARLATRKKDHIRDSRPRHEQYAAAARDRRAIKEYLISHGKSKTIYELTQHFPHIRQESLRSRVGELVATGDVQRFRVGFDASRLHPAAPKQPKMIIFRRSPVAPYDRDTPDGELPF
jgi:hypothetical protein